MSDDTKSTTGSKILFAVMLLLTFLSVSATYYNFVILHDFEIVNDLDEADLEE